MGRLILTALAIGVAIGTAINDLGGSHSMNEAWPPHARFHGVWWVVFVILMQGVAIWSFWTRRTRIGVSIIGLYLMSFLLALVMAPVFDAGLAPDVAMEAMPSRVFGMEQNLLSILVAIPVLLAGWWSSERRQG